MMASFDEYAFHQAVFRVVSPLVFPLAKLQFRYTYEKLSSIPEPYLLLANHNTDFDPIFLGLASEHQVYFVATEKILRMGLLSPFVMRFFHPIIHYKGKTGISSVKEILGRLRERKNVALFPEGNRSFNGLTGDFVSATGKLAKRSGATLVTYRLRGGYFTSPRWGKGLRRGKMLGEIAHVYPPETLKQMSEGEINEAIRQDLFVDAYSDQKRQRIPYKGKNLALGLESTLFQCPQCGAVSSLHSEGNEIFCSCGYRAEYDVFGYLHDGDGSVVTITDLDQCQHKAVENLLEQSSDALLFEDSVKAESIGPDHQVLSEARTTLRAWRDGLAVGELFLQFSSITGMAINQRNLLIIHHTLEENGHLELSGDLSFSALKYLYLYQSARKINEKI